jgi:hypothetical protein
VPTFPIAAAFAEASDKYVEALKGVKIPTLFPAMPAIKDLDRYLSPASAQNGGQVKVKSVARHVIETMLLGLYYYGNMIHPIQNSQSATTVSGKRDMSMQIAFGFRPYEVKHLQELMNVNSDKSTLSFANRAKTIRSLVGMRGSVDEYAADEARETNSSAHHHKKLKHVQAMLDAEEGDEENKVDDDEEQEQHNSNLNAE